MAGRRLPAAAIPTPGPWLVRGQADPEAPPHEVILEIEPASEGRPGGWPYLVRRAASVEYGDCPLHIATGIQRLADARLIAAAPDLSAALLSVLTAPALMRHDLDAATRAAIDAAWALLIRAAPHMEIGP
jgi:hypothetical protein